MSWDVKLTSKEHMGTKEDVREKFMAACGEIVGRDISRRGPTEVHIDNSFDYELFFNGHKRAIDSLTICFNIKTGDPQKESDHCVRSFLSSLCSKTGWHAIDTYSGEQL